MAVSPVLQVKHENPLESGTPPLSISFGNQDFPLVLVRRINATDGGVL